MTITTTIENPAPLHVPPHAAPHEPRAAGSSPNLIARYPMTTWSAPMIFGISMILIGIIAFSTVIVTSLVSVIALGAFLVITGTFELVSAVRHRNYRPFVGYFVAGVLSVALGAVFVMWPLASLETLTLFVVGYLLIGASFRQCGRGRHKDLRQHALDERLENGLLWTDSARRTPSVTSRSRR